MSTPHEDSLHARALEDLGSIALGENAEPDLAQHIASCRLCRAELDALQHVVALARSANQPDEDDTPPPAVWDRIATEVAASAPLPAPAPWWRRGLLVAATVVAIAGAGVGGWAIGHGSGSSAPGRATQAALQAQPGTREDVHGTAAVHQAAEGYRLAVDTRGLPARSGYYEVWLYDPDVNTMVAVGTLGTGGRGTFTVPGGLDLKAFHVVDVSAQNYDGNAAHGRSVLRGTLTG